LKNDRVRKNVKNIDLVKRRANVRALESRSRPGSSVGTARRVKGESVDRFGKIAKLVKTGAQPYRRRAAFILIYHKMTNCKVARAVERPKFAFFQPRENFRPKKIPLRPLFAPLIGPNVSSPTLFAFRRRSETPR
jgi:hypothetical protein